MRNNVLRKKSVSPVAVAQKCVLYLCLTAVALVFLFPMLTMLSKSLMTATEVRELPVRLLPQALHFSNYLVIAEAKYVSMFFNTLIVVGINMVVGPLMAAFSAFGFARMHFKLKKPIFAFIMSTLMLPALITQIPTYILYAKLNLLNSLAPLYLSTFFGGGVLNIFLIIQFMRTIPKDIDNAALIDGAGPFRIFLTVILPLCKPILIYLAISIFSGVWNDVQNPLIYLSTADENKYTLSLGFFFDFGRGGKLELFKNKQMALGVLMTIPPAAVFLVFQKQLLDGVIMTAVKG